MNTYTILLTVTDKLVATLAEDGWRQATTAELAGACGIHAARIDQGVCLESTCDECGGVGAHHVPFLQNELGRLVEPGTPPAYRAFAVCHACGAAREF